MESSYPPLPSPLLPVPCPFCSPVNRLSVWGKSGKIAGRGKGWEPSYFREIKYLFKTFFKFNWRFGECFPPFCYNTLTCIHPLSRTVFLYRILKIKPIVARQVLDGRLIEVRTMARLSLKRQKDGSDCLIAVAAQQRFNFPFFTTTAISGHLLLVIIGRWKWFNCIFEVAAQSRFNFPVLHYNYFGALITGRSMEV